MLTTSMDKDDGGNTSIPNLSSDNNIVSSTYDVGSTHTDSFNSMYDLTGLTEIEINSTATDIWTSAETLFSTIIDKDTEAYGDSSESAIT